MTLTFAMLRHWNSWGRGAEMFASVSHEVHNMLGGETSGPGNAMLSLC